MAHIVDGLYELYSRKKQIKKACLNIRFHSHEI